MSRKGRFPLAQALARRCCQLPARRPNQVLRWRAARTRSERQPKAISAGGALALLTESSQSTIRAPGQHDVSGCTDSLVSAWPRACVRPFDQVLTDINFLPALETQHCLGHVDASEARDLVAVVFAIGHENVQGDNSCRPRIHVNRPKVWG